MYPLLVLEAYAMKNFIFLIDAVGYQVSPIIILFWKPTLITIINLTCQEFHPFFFKPIHIHAWFNCFSFTWSLNYKNNFLVRFSFSFEVAFSQPFLTSAGYMTTSENSWVIVWIGTVLILIILTHEMNSLTILQQP